MDYAEPAATAQSYAYEPVAPPAPVAPVAPPAPKFTAVSPIAAPVANT